ncbi:MAG: bifunctional oligoribonuclease/PAP phosphatase NrnA [Armatimonadetes bacterium]|nr:MAG: bifunctional oligoribonuclease/PAP phosphatase NrnA [Armatimonadota bacterium]
MTDSNAVAEIAKALADAGSIGVVGHVGPDGDALGSMIGLALAARNAGKKAVASFDEPFVVPAEMSFLDTSALVKPSEFPTDLDLAVAVDTSVEHRVGALAGAMGKAKRLAVIDHHISDGSWGDVLLIDPTAAATTELVYRVLKDLGWNITKPVADALYTGLVTDTGRFQYSSTSSATHAIAADLLAAGVEPDVIGQKLFEEEAFGYYSVASKVLDRAVLDDDHAFVWSLMTMADLEAAGVKYHQVDGLIDLVRMARGTEVACLLKEAKPGVYKGSLRSRGTVDVSAIAGSFGGGGHHNASGFTSTSDPETIIQQIVSQLS